MHQLWIIVFCSANTEPGDENVTKTETTDMFGVGLNEWVDMSWQNSEDDSSFEGESVVNSDYSDGSINGDNRFAFVLSNDCCNNCHRKYTQSGPMQYQVRLRECRVCWCHFQCKFSNYHWAEVVLVAQASGSHVNGDFMWLKFCQHCHEYLMLE